LLPKTPKPRIIITMHLLNNAVLKQKQEQVFKKPVNFSLPLVEKGSISTTMEENTQQLSSVV